MSEQTACPWAAQHHTADLRQRLDQANARIAELEAERKWRPIESAPKDGSLIQACTQGGKRLEMIVVTHWHRLGETNIWKWAGELNYPEWRFTHWRPLGPGPEGSE